MDDSIVCRKFFLTIHRASDLPNVRQVFETRAYAKVSIGSGDNKIKSRTPADNRNGLNPVWSHDMTYEIAESGVLYYGLSVVIKVYCQRTLGDRLIGEVHTTMKDLFDCAPALEGRRHAGVSLPITTNGSERTGGFLDISYSFGESFNAVKSDFMTRVLKNGGVRVLVEVATDVLVDVAANSIVLAVLLLL